MKNQKLPFSQALSVGALAGMRATAAPLIVSHILSQSHSYELEDSPLDFMQSKTTAAIFKFIALGEIVMDKLPSTPDRIKTSAVGGRIMSGALAGAALYKAHGGSIAAGALVGAAAAYASSFASFFLRKAVVDKCKIYDPIIGAVEDAIVVGLGVELCRMKEGSTI
ncbi:MAG: DUF4126 family protein [Flavipsychrobacter sp.]|nr:DUF4126 family protein [Flavipsychrobacter sp.]